MFMSLFRTIILYSIVVLIIRLMGKRQIGELQPFELVIAIMISDLASFPMQDTRIPLINGVIPIVTLLVLQIIISIVTLKSEKIRGIVCGKPSIVIKKGKIDISQLKSQRLNINDLLEELRLQGYFNLEDVEYAILETSGKLSVIPKTELTPATKKELKMPCTQDSVPITLILDGKINRDNLSILKKDLHWLDKQLKEHQIPSPEEVFIGMLDSQGKLFFQTKKE